MKKLITGLLAGLLLVGCGTATSEAVPEVTQENVEEAVQQIEEQAPDLLAQAQEQIAGLDLKILSPNGAPALAVLPAAVGGKVDFVDGADALQAAFVNPDGDYDLIVAPSNLGMKLASAGKTAYKMLGVVTWGNLYIVAKTGTDKDPSTWEKVAAFGEQSVTGIVFNTVYGNKIDSSKITWYNSTAEASAALIAGDADVAMLAEPNATATIAKAKENGLELEIIDDVQSAYGEGGFPQAALFVKESSYADKKAAIDTVFTLMNAFTSVDTPLTADQLQAMIDAAGGAETMGVPAAQMIEKVWPRLNIHVVKASERKADLEKFASLFGIEDISAALAE